MQSPRAIGLAGLLLLFGACILVLGSRAGEAPVAGLPTVVTQNTAVPVAEKVGTPTPTSLPELNPGDCPVTKPPELPFTAPAPYRPSAPWAGQFWYGTDLLWTALPESGTWSSLPQNPDGYGQKVVWWREGYSWKDNPTPDLTVTGKRFDAPAPPLHASQATNAYAEDIGSAMMVGVDFPTPGCWEVTGKVPDQQLSFVIWVQP